MRECVSVLLIQLCVLASYASSVLSSCSTRETCESALGIVIIE